MLNGLWAKAQQFWKVVNHLRKLQSEIGFDSVFDLLTFPDV